MSRFRPLAPILMLCAATTLAGSEVMRRDVQLALAMSDPAFEYNIQAPIGTFSGSDSFDRLVELRLGGRWSWSRPGWQVAPIFGGDVVATDGAYGSGGMRAYGLDLAAGVAWAPLDRWQFEAEVAYGRARTAFALPATSTGVGLDASGDTTRQRLSLVALRSVGRYWWLTGELNLAGYDGDLGADGGRELSVSGMGWGAAIGLAWRWSMRPEALE